MEKLSLDKKSLRDFGMTMGIAFLVITMIFYFRHKQAGLYTAIISLVFLVSALSLPNFLKPIYIFWMRLAFVLGWINTRLILLVMFYLIFTPIGLVMRLFGVDLLHRRIETNKDSYWLKKAEKVFNPLDYERQF